MPCLPARPPQLSMLVCYPAGYQHAQELVHRMYMTHPAVHRVGLYTTAVLTASLVSSCLLYLVGAGAEGGGGRGARGRGAGKVHAGGGLTGEGLLGVP